MCEHQTPFGWCGFFLWGSKGVAMAQSDNEKKFKTFMYGANIKESPSKKMEEAFIRLETMGLTPFAFSGLNQHLALDAWHWKDALLLIAGASPRGANWTSPNFVDIFQCPICCCSN
jgi:hypothetical protein